jgi:hypothetical protein
MDPGEAEELGRFRKAIELAELADLAPIIALTLDHCIDALRRVGGSNLGTEQAAALAAELHKRHARPDDVARAPMVGTA